MARLDKQYQDIASIIVEQRSQFEKMLQRFSALELKLANVDFGEGILPAEIANEVSPGQVYIAAVQAAIIARSMANPVGIAGESTRAANLRQVFDIAEAAMNESVKRCMLRKKTKK